MFKIFKSKKEVLVSDMKEVYDGLRSAAEGRQKYAQNWKDFGNYVKVMVLSQNSTLEEQMNKLCELFTAISDCQKNIADAELRNAEDFNDVQERFTVVYRKNEEYNNQKRQFRDYEAELKDAIAKNEAESKKANYTKNQQKLEANIERLRKLKAEALELTKQKLQDVIEAREAYNVFKVRRFKHGWTTYGTTLKEESEKEAKYLQQVEDLLLTLKTDLESGKLGEIRDKLQDQVNAAPNPVDVVEAAESLEAPAAEDGEQVEQAEQ